MSNWNSISSHNEESVRGEWATSITGEGKVDSPSSNEMNSGKLEEDDEVESDEEELINGVRKRLSASFTGSNAENFTSEFLRPLQQKNSKARAEDLEAIIGFLKSSLLTESKDLIKHHLPSIVRYATEVPFDDVAISFQELLKIVEQTGLFTIPKPIPAPSKFVRNALFPPVNTHDEVYRKIFVDLFLQNGRVSHLNRVLAIHPSFFEKSWATFTFIMTESGPLPLDWRNYIAILAASRHHCMYLVQYQEQEFLSNGGQPKWLEGIDHIPKKLQNLLPVNQILSHQPWTINKDIIQPLLRGADSWSIGELVQAMIIICTFNALAGIVFGCGVSEEVDYGDSTTVSEVEEEDQKVPSNIVDDTKKITALLTGGWETEEPDEQQESLFVKAETVDHPPINKGGNVGRLRRFIGNSDMTHEDFDVKSKSYGIFRVQDWNWKEGGFELVRRFLPGAATLMEEEFDHIYTMTYNMFNQSKNVDTFPFRRAIWQYVQRVKGMFHDDYNYQEVNIFLNKSTKSYIKKISCFPETITKNDFRDVGYELTPDEKVHVALLAVNSSKQSTLLYGLHAVMKHMYT